MTADASAVSRSEIAARWNSAGAARPSRQLAFVWLLKNFKFENLEMQAASSSPGTAPFSTVQNICIRCNMRIMVEVG